MTALQEGIRALTGCGVTVRQVENQRLQIQGDTHRMKQADLSPIQHHKCLLINLLPPDQWFSAAEVDNLLDWYEERAAIICEGSPNMDIHQAYMKAILCVREFAARL